MGATAVPRIAILIVNWNKKQDTLDCFESLRAQNYKNIHVILVDNGSTDGTSAAVHALYPEVTVIVNDTNLGFAAGNNVGIRYAVETGAEYIALLNNDTTVDPAMFDELLKVIESDPHVGIVGPKMLYFDQPNVIWCAGNLIRWNTGDTVRLHAEEQDDRAEQSPLGVDFVTGCAILLRRQVIEQIGLLDPRFFLYYEETDWCVRATMAGWRIVYVPRARLYHKVSAAMGTPSLATDYYMNRNVLLFLAKNRRGIGRLVSLFLATFENLRVTLAFTVKSHDGKRLPHRNVRLMALRDAITGRWGKMGKDVAAICYPDAR
jgi:GT2 family glycosyltransferase